MNKLAFLLLMGCFPVFAQDAQEWGERVNAIIQQREALGNQAALATAQVWKMERTNKALQTDLDATRKKLCALDKKQCDQEPEKMVIKPAVQLTK